MDKHIKTLQASFSSSLSHCASTDDLEKLRVSIIEKKGKLTQLLKQLSTLSIEEKKTYGPLLNKLKASFQQDIENKYM